MRTDLNMRRGKQIAQGAHASLKVLLDNNIIEQEKYLVDGDPIKEWLEGLFTKICVQVSSEQELLDIYNKAKENNLLCTLIQDAGLTEFGGVATYTCLAIGPHWSEDIDVITGHLKLL